DVRRLSIDHRRRIDANLVFARWNAIPRLKRAQLEAAVLSHVAAGRNFLALRPAFKHHLAARRRLAVRECHRAAHRLQTGTAASDQHEKRSEEQSSEHIHYW